MGRPSKLTPTRHAEIVRKIATGAYAHIAAQASGVHPATYYQWMGRGRDAERTEDGTALHDDDRPYVEFHDAVKEAEAKAETVAIGRIQQAANGGTWQAAAWYLERKYADRWGRKDQLRQEISGPDGGKIEIEAEAAVMGFLDERHDRLEEAGVIEGDPTETTPDTLTETDISDTPTGGTPNEAAAGGFLEQLGGH